MIGKAIFCLGLVFANTYPSLIASYEFSGTAFDGSGNAHHGTVVGAEFVADRFGNANSALAFDGEGSYVSIPQLGLGGAVSVSGWFEFPDGIWPKHVAILGQGTNYFNRWQLGASNNEVFWYDRRGTDNAPYNIILQTHSNQWHHIAAILTDDQGAALKAGIWLDGEYIGSLSTREFQEINAGYRIGSFWTEWGWEYSLGKIDDVLVYDHMLSEADILALFHAQSVPEPTGFLLFAFGAVSIVGAYRRKRK